MGRSLQVEAPLPVEPVVLPDPRPNWRRRAVTGAVVGLSRWCMRRLNRLEIEGGDALTSALQSGRGLLTFSNHVSLFDDPLLTSCLVDVPWERVRWIGADATNFFGSPLRARLFAAGKCVPIVRGVGTDQPGMHFMAERLSAGDWVHLFPEGGRTRTPGQLVTPLKAGLAVLMQRSRPLALPFRHEGMEAILPIGARWPRRGATVHVRFGEVIDTAQGLADQGTAEQLAWAEKALNQLKG